MRWKVSLRWSQEPEEALTVTSFIGYTILTVGQLSLCSLSSCLAACLLREDFPDPSTCIQFTAPSQTRDYLTSCRTPEFGIKDYLDQRLAERMWQRYVHALSRGTEPVYRQSSRSARLCCPHLLAHSYCLGAGLSVLLVTAARTVLGWMNGGCSRGQVQVPPLYAEYSLAAHFP